MTRRFPERFRESAACLRTDGRTVVPFQPGNKLGRRFKPGVSGNPGGVPKGIKHYSVKALYGEVFDDDEVRSKTVQGLRADLGSARTRLHALELAAKVNKEIGSGAEVAAAVKIIINTNVDFTKLRPRGADYFYELEHLFLAAWKNR